MASIRISPNRREVLSAISTLTGNQEYLTSTNGILNTSGSGGGGGGGTQYTSGTTTVANPIGTIPVYDNAGTITAVSVANPLPVTAAVTITGVATSANQTNGTQLTGLVAGTAAIGSITNTSFIVSQATASSLNATVVGTGTFAAQVTGNVTANAGTNLNTSALALETGGNLATVAGLSLAQGSTTSTEKGVLQLGAVTTGSPSYTTAQSSPLSLTLTGALRIDGSATTQPVSGTVTANAGTGTFAISATSLPLPTGAATSANQTNGTQLTGLVAGSAAIGSITNTSFGATQATASSLNATVVQGTAAALTAGWPTINGELGDVTGTFTNATQTTSVTASNLDGYGNTLISINGTYNTATAVFEGSDDGGTTWYAVQAARDNSNVIELGYTGLTNISQTWQINNPGFDSLRVRSTAVASGTVNVRMSSSAAPVASGTIVGIGTSIPTGTNAIGTVGTTSAVINVGQQTVNTTAVQVSSTSTVPTNGIIIQALSTNAGSIFVGGSGVTTSTGFELVAGQAMSFSCNLNTLFIRSVASTTDKICWNVE